MSQDLKMEFVFFGTDDFSVAVLERLSTEGFTPSLIVTVPDRPKGRALKLSPPPIKLWAAKHGVPFLQPVSLSDPSVNFQLSTFNFQLFIVASYGKIIPKTVLDIPAKGVLNVHPSLLPKFRGASPVQSAILSGDKKTGVTIMLMDEKMDHGPILAQRELAMTNREKQIAKAGKLEKALADIGGKLLAETIPDWLAGEIKAVPQDESKASYCGKFEKSDALVNLAAGPYENYLKIKAFDRPPVAHAILNRNGRDTRVLIKEADYQNGSLILKRVLPEGGREMSYEDFLKGER